MSRGNVSECSTDHDSSSSEEALVRSFAKHMLRGKIFVGTYSEKRRVDQIGAYRDIVLVNNTETELIRDLNSVVKRIRGCFVREWIGVTPYDEIGAHCLWVDLKQQVFGSYWFKVKTVRFTQNEICLELKQVRPLEEVKVNEARDEVHVGDVLQQKAHELFEAGMELLTPENIKNTTVFLSVLAITVLTGLVQLGRYALDFSLKLMRETSYLVRSLTPFAVSIIGMLEKIVGGFYILLAMIWRDYRNPQPPRNAGNNRLTYTNTAGRNNMLTYGNPQAGYDTQGKVYRSGVYIEEVQ